MMEVSLSNTTYGKEEIAEVMHSLETGRVTMGAKVELFERMFEDYVGIKHAVMVNSGSSANLLALAALQRNGNLRLGDEILVPALTWSTGIWPVIQLGMIPVFLDADINTLCVDSGILFDEQKKFPRPYFPAHILGNIAPWYYESNPRGPVIEDCCEALGSKRESRLHVGAGANVSTFSFYFSHHITTIEGGMVATDSAELADILRSMRSHGWIRGMSNEQELAEMNPDLDSRFLFVNDGYNFRPTEINAAFGIHQLPKLEEMNDQRRNVAELMLEKLQGIDEIWVPKPSPRITHSWFAFPTLLSRKQAINKAGFVKHLQDNGIQTRPILAGNMTEQPAMKGMKYKIAGSGLSVADDISYRGLYWACHSGMNDTHVDHIVETVKQYFSKRMAA